MRWAAAALGAVGIAIAVFGGPVQALTERAGGDLMRRGPYVEAVLGAG